MLGDYGQPEAVHCVHASKGRPKRCRDLDAVAYGLVTYVPVQPCVTLSNVPSEPIAELMEAVARVAICTPEIAKQLGEGGETEPSAMGGRFRKLPLPTSAPALTPNSRPPPSKVDTSSVGSVDVTGLCGEVAVLHLCGKLLWCI